MSDKKSEFETALETLDAPETRLRLEALKRRLDLHENDAIWLYIVALENYQRLYEAAPRQIRAAADAERERLQGEANLIIAKAAQQAAATLVVGIDTAITKRAAAALWGQRALAIAGALCLASTSAVLAGVMSTPIPSWIMASHNDHAGPLLRVVAAIWNAPAGWVVFLALAGAGFAYWAEYAAVRLAAHLNNERA